MPSDDHVFLFASLDSKPPLTTRKVHIRRLYDILQLSIQRQDFERAKRVWAILVHCKEIDWKALWTMGLLILERDSSESNEKNEVEFLRTIMLQYPDDVRFNLFKAEPSRDNRSSVARIHPQRTGISSSSCRKVSRSFRRTGTVPIDLLSDKILNETRFQISTFSSVSRQPCLSYIRGFVVALSCTEQIRCAHRLTDLGVLF